MRWQVPDWHGGPAASSPLSTTKARELAARDLPIAAELLSACTRAGSPTGASLTIVAAAIRGPLGDRLHRIAAHLELGSDPVTEWRRLETDPLLGPLARAMVRAAESGAPPADSLARLAVDRRRDRRAVLLARARSVGVASAAPLAGCFLPAFMLIGVVPTIVSGFTTLIG